MFDGVEVAQFTASPTALGDEGLKTLRHAHIMQSDCSAQK